MADQSVIIFTADQKIVSTATITPVHTCFTVKRVVSALTVDDVIAANPQIAEKIRGGKVQAAGALIGQIMKVMKGQADAKRVRELILEKLS